MNKIIKMLIHLFRCPKTMRSWPDELGRIWKVDCGCGRVIWRRYG